MEHIDRMSHYRNIWFALRAPPEAHAEIATRAMASMRLILVEVVGEVEQRQLIAKWNEELNDQYGA